MSNKLQECASCLGSGQSALPLFGRGRRFLPTDCKYCKGTGKVPAIHNSAFVNEHLFDSYSPNAYIE